MSDHERNICDPIIDTVDESDEENEDVVPSTPASERVEQADPTQDIGSYNGDSLVVTGSPFKKSYSGSSLGEASVDSLVDEPLPIESVALSPFRMASIHHSPLPPRQKDPHTFSVSVSDSLPPHVMELDSPEHPGERNDETEHPGFEGDKDNPLKVCEEVEEFFSGVREEASSEVEVSPSAAPSATVREDVECRTSPPLRNTQPEKESEGTGGDGASTSEGGGPTAPYSQPMFDTQTSQGKADSPVPPPDTEDSNPPSPHPSNPTEDSEPPLPSKEDELLSDEDIIPPTDSQSKDFSKSPDTHPLAGSPVSAHGAPKRKRGPHPGEEEDDDAEIVRKRPPNLSGKAVAMATAEEVDEPEECLPARTVTIAMEEPSAATTTREQDSDSDIEILEEERSIEVVYDGGATPAGVESQDLNLVLTGDTQGSQRVRDSDPPPHPSGDEEMGRESSSQSPSLLSMVDSELPLTCGDAFSAVSSPESGGTSPQENTIRATQVELLCPKPPSPKCRSPTHPDVEPLVRLPIRGAHSPSTNGVAEDGNTQESGREGASPPHSEEEFEPTSLSCPQFDTPSQSQMSQEPSESMFVRASRAAHERRRLEEERVATRSPVGVPSDECVSNHSTPLSAIEPPSKSSQSTPISSQPGKGSPDEEPPNTHKLFPHISQERPPSGEATESPLQMSQVYAEDSDEDAAGAETTSSRSQHKREKLLEALTPSRRRGPLHRVKKASTPVEAEGAASSPDLGSTLGSGQATFNSSEENRASPPGDDPARADTAEVEECVRCVRDLFDRGWVRKGTLAPLEYWVNPVTNEGVLRLVGLEDRLLKPRDLLSEVVALSETAKGDRRISDISSISRVTSITTSSSGYLADRSLSSTTLSSNPSLERSESTRLSIASVTTLPSPPRLPPYPLGDSSSSSSSSSSFRLPQPPPPLPSHVPKAPSTKDAQTQTEDVNSPQEPQRLPSPSPATEKGVPATPPKRAGRGRGRAGRSRGRPKGARSRRVTQERPVVEVPPPIEEEVEGVFSKAPSSRLDVPTEEDDLYASLLPDDLREKLRTAYIPLTEDEEELFLLQEARSGGGDLDAHARQLEEVQRRVRVAAIEPHSLVFARYLDNNYYSAFAERRLGGDRWDIHYNLDGCKLGVRELYILPTEILPKGTRCHVRQPDLKYSDPGVVRGHVLSSPGTPRQPLLQHVVETHKGQMVRVPHSQIILSQTVVEALLEPRRAFHSMIASPGGDVSLDNVVPGKLRRGRATSGSPQKGRKLDPLFDSSETDEGHVKRRSAPKGKSTPRRTPHRVPTTISEGTSESEDPSASSPPPSKLVKRAAVKAPPVSTPKTPRNSRTPKTPRTPAGGRSSRPSRVKRTLSSEMEPPTEPPSDGTLMNPVVELEQLDEKDVTPPNSNSSKKRVRRAGSGVKSSRKAMKMEEGLDEDDPDETDSKLGPLPPSGCQILKGYSILITLAKNLSRRNSDDYYNEHCAPLDKEYLKTQISGANGYVVETFEEANLLHIQTLQQSKKGPNLIPAGRELHELKQMPADKSPSKVLCVSNSFCRTAKFIQCLTVGIPLVSSQWVIQSIMQDVPVNWLQFLLPAGMSLLTGNLMEQTFKDNLKDTFSAVGNVVDVLQGEKVFLATSSNPDFRELWSTLLNAAKANVHKMPPKAGNIQRIIDRRTAVVIADASIPEEELRRAQDVGVPVVSSEWFIQSLIARCKLPYDAHPHFAYTHKALASKDTPPVVGADEEEDGGVGRPEGGHTTTRKR